MYICDLVLCQYMVFGWGKKEQVVEERRDKPVASTHKEITLEDIPSIIEDITNLRQKTLIAEVKSFQKRVESDKKILLSIADDLGKDNLKTDDMDPHLEILVNRGKKEVISSIQKVIHKETEKTKKFEQKTREIKKNFFS